MRTGLAVAAAVALALGCGPTEPEPRNLVLVSIDTVRADHLGCYGHERDTSPHLDRFAAAGVLFEQASAAAPWTLPSHASLLTGLYPRGHGVRTQDHRLADDVPTLASVLGEGGFETGGVVNTLFLAPRSGMARGFDSFEVVESDQSRRGAAAKVTGRALAWLEARDRKRPVFLFVHYYDAHSDYRSLPRYERLFPGPPGRFDGRTAQLLAAVGGVVRVEPADASHLARLYDAGIRQLDDELGRFLRRLEEGGWLANTLVVVTSDHGEEFLEHGGLLHGSTHYQEMLRVPLLMRGPGLPAGVRVASPVSLVDVVPTVLGVLGVPAPLGFEGVDLRALWEPPAAARTERAVFAEADSHDRRSLRRGRYKLIVGEGEGGGERELYDLALDPEETRNLAAERPDLTDALGTEIDGFAAASREPERAPELGEAEREHLRALGYLRHQDRRRGAAP